MGGEADIVVAMIKKLSLTERAYRQLRDDLLTEGFERMTAAAQAGWPAAQAGLAEALFEIANEDALAEAAPIPLLYWDRLSTPVAWRHADDWSEEAERLHRERQKRRLCPAGLRKKSCPWNPGGAREPMAALH